MLHVTNGDVAVAAIREAGVAGEIVAWRDVLHEGPVPAGLTLDELREVRARFVATQGWGKFEEVQDDLRVRDAAIARADEHDETILWFEDDLHDQLQLLQAIDGLGRLPERGSPRSLVPVEGPIAGMDPGGIGRAFARRARIGPEHLAAAGRGWGAFRSPDPTAIEEVLRRGSGPALPFLDDALRRLLEEYPSVREGLSRTELQALDAIAAGAATVREAYVAAHHRREERVFLADAVFAMIVGRLAGGPRPLIEAFSGDPLRPPRDPVAASAFWSARPRLTAVGRLVLEGREDATRLNGVNRWVGGVHLHGHEPGWRWDAAARKLKASVA